MLKSRMTAVVRDARTILRILRNPRAPIAARLTAALVAGYVLSPIQLIPTFIPVIGQLDDVFVIAMGNIVIKRIVDPELLLECSPQA